MQRYRDIANGKEEPEQDCTLAHIKPFFQPNLYPEKFERRNLYLESIMERVKDYLPGTKYQQWLKGKKIRSELRQRITLHAMDPGLLQMCHETKALGEPQTLHSSVQYLPLPRSQHARAHENAHA